MVEENDRPGGERGQGAEGSSRRMEGDLLAERRALRAAEGGEAVLVRRAEAAEATVHTLERHVTSLQQRLAEADGERQRLAELLEAERTVAVEREGELRRVKQREYAEQQLRVEAEDRLVGLDRESRAGVQELSARLQDSERHSAELAAKLDAMQRQLAEAEQAIAAERSATRRLDEGLRARIAELEVRAAEIERGLASERSARERSERLLEAIRGGHRRMEAIVRDVRTAVGRLGGALAAGTAAPSGATLAHDDQAGQLDAARPTSPPYGRPLLRAPQRSDTPQPRGNEMAEALAAAVERLRARAETAPLSPSAPPPGGTDAGRQGPPLPSQQAPAEPGVGRERTPGHALADTGPAPSAPPPSAPAAHVSERVPHKHSMSLIGRIRFRRKQRRSR